MTVLPLPGDAAQRIRDFLKAKRTGSITLHASEGTVCSVEIRDAIRFKRNPNNLDTVTSASVTFIATTTD